MISFDCLIFYDCHRLIGIWQSISNKKGNPLSTEMVDYIRSKQAVVDSIELGAFPTLDISSCRLEDETVSLQYQ